ncbi:peptidyl-prolyl cis-trans isomerase [Shewanella sp. D64]|uniref:peptidylprolyl isomerase n=1 Tax=unclassified Shewanella TaxID=196818 RepID=UPI0022BA6EE0|nr:MULTISPECIES: peptidylprolyl isomerase [unclassified Shewanella]MEC4728348.1 peptidyl-prolyl cis-trans isomerase [Shewanella sp. D64]MEC4737318.1 peptidyl-prolyl cis-trans isomerase [Shewanella sp. E94]WBJ93695.1 peptidyl-prolyl cis-trans isomerase [Shewanella sp. MTB7]
MITLHTNHGDIVLELDAEKAPITAENFTSYVKDGFFDGTIFHRVIDGFMVQGGGFTEDMVQKDNGETIKNEANNGLSNLVGTIAMARTSDPHSATAQFFINLNDNTFLDFKSETSQGWGYCVFGKVSAGMDVVNKIKAVNTGNRGMHQDVPLEAVVIEKVTITDAE